MDKTIAIVIIVVALLGGLGVILLFIRAWLGTPTLSTRKTRAIAKREEVSTCLKKIS